MGLTKLRQRAKAGYASDIATAILDELEPDWRDDLRQQRWRATLAGVVRWREQHGRLPTRKGKTAVEQRFGRWLGTQRQDSTGVGSGADSFERHGRRADLDQHLPGWGPTKRPSWDERLAELRRWVSSHPGAVPNETSPDRRERAICVWLTIQRTDADLTPSRSAALEEVFPGWRNPAMLRWRSRLSELVAFHTTHARLPSRHGGSAAEASLHAWVAQQRKLERLADRAFVADDRAALLDTAVPGWRGRPRLPK